jgi:hypothetical protein
VNISEFTESFVNFEEKHDLFSITLRDACFWEYIRYTVFEQIIHIQNSFSIKRNRNYFRYFYEMIQYGIAQARMTLKRSRKYDILLINYNRCNIIDGKSVNIHMHFIDKVIHDIYKTVLVDPHGIIRNKTSYHCDILNLRPAYLICRLKAHLIFFSKEEEKIFLVLQKKVEDHFGLVIDIHQLAKDIFAFHLMYKKVYRRLFKKLNTKLIIYCNDGNQKGMLDAASELKIKTVDFQHSQISPLNIIYNYSHKTNLKPIRKTTPDYIFSFGSFWTKEFRLSSEVIPVGFPYFEKMAKKHLACIPDQKGKNIIIISILFSREILTEIALGISELLPEYTIYYKLRSDEYQNWENHYPEKFKKRKNIVVVDSDVFPLYEIFSRCGFQVSVNSTAIYEGLAFGLITFIVKHGWYQEMKRLYEDKHVFLVTSSNEISEIIRNDKKPEKCLTLDEIFKQDSLANLQQAIVEIMEKGVGQA